MRQFTGPLAKEDSSARVAYRVLRPGKDPSLYGVWWPRSHDLAAELTALIGVLDSRGFLARSVTVNQKFWSTVAPWLRVAGRTVRLTRLRSTEPRIDADAGMVRLGIGHSRARVDLLVLPPGSHPAMAAHAFARIVGEDGRFRGGRRTSLVGPS